MAISGITMAVAAVSLHIDNGLFLPNSFLPNSGDEIASALRGAGHMRLEALNLES
jgi:hypothetical protein